MKALLSLLLFPVLVNAQATVSGGALDNAEAADTREHLTFSGHVVRADNGRPIEGATVILAPCIGCEGSYAEVPAHDPVATTAADGSYIFADIPWRLVWIHAAHTGFVPTASGCNACAGNTISVDLKMESAAIPTPMNDGALKAVYGDIRPYLYFRVATFTPDGNFIQFITLDGYHGGPETSWKYDLRTGSLESGPVIPDDESDTRTVGEYSVTVGPSCRGCGGSIVARNLKTGREFEITSSTDSGFVGSSDGKVIFWSDGRMMVSALGTRQTTHITLPSSPGFEPLAARPEGDGYLLAYDVAGPCNFDGPALVQQIESDQAEKVAQKDPNASARQPHNLCFLHVSVPAR